MKRKRRVHRKLWLNRIRRFEREAVTAWMDRCFYPDLEERLRQWIGENIALLDRAVGRKDNGQDTWHR